MKKSEDLFLQQLNHEIRIAKEEVKRCDVTRYQSYIKYKLQLYKRVKDWYVYFKKNK